MPAFEEALVAISIVLIVGGVILPPFIGKRYFWFFRRSEKKTAVDEVIAAKDHMEEAQRHAEAARIEAEARKLERQAEDTAFETELRTAKKSKS